MGWYTGKKVLIAGGSKGIGRSLALRLAKDGAHVVVTARGQKDLDDTVAAMRAAAPQATFGAISFDVTDTSAARDAVGQAISTLGGLDILVCNSGVARPGYTHDVPDDVFRNMMDVNYLGHVNVVRAALPHFMAQGSGHICLISSMMGFLPLYGYSAYSASKFAIVGFAESLRQELKPVGVKVSVFYPPTTDTPGLATENEFKPADVWKLESDSAFSHTYTADQVGDAIAAFIVKGSFEGVIGAMNWFIYYVARHFPGLTRWMADDEVAKARKKVAAEQAAAQA